MAGVPADQAFVTDAITAATTAGPFIDTNTNYLLTSAYLVFFMHCGFAMVWSVLCLPVASTHVYGQPVCLAFHQLLLSPLHLGDGVYECPCRSPSGVCAPASPSTLLCSF